MSVTIHSMRRSAPHLRERLSFELASTVFGDPLALSRYDVEHFEGEDRRVALRQAENAMLLVVVHTFEELNTNEARVRIISARNATARERTQYESGHAPQVNTMKDQYDFSNATRGKFHRPDAALEIPVYLDAPVRDYLIARAKAKGVEVNELVNELLKRGIDLIEAGK